MRGTGRSDSSRHPYLDDRTPAIRTGRHIGRSIGLRQTLHVKGQLTLDVPVGQAREVLTAQRRVVNSGHIDEIEEELVRVLGAIPGVAGGRLGRELNE